MSKFEDFVYLTIQSAGRPQNVKPMLKALAPIVPVWFVPFGQQDAYRAEGALVVPVVGEVPMKPKQLNEALKMAWNNGKIAVTMDDDYVRTKKLYVDAEGKIKTRDVSLPDFLNEMLVEMLQSDYKLGGVSANMNPLWGAETSTDYGMITGQVMFHKLSHIRFDENMPMMEDLEIVLRHHQQFGGVMKNRSFLQEFHMMGRNAKSDATHSGGYANARNEQRLATAVGILQNKYQDEDVIIENNGLGNSSHSKVKFKNFALKNRL